MADTLKLAPFDIPIGEIPHRVHDQFPDAVRAMLHLSNIQWQYSISKFAWLLELRLGAFYVIRLVDDSELQDVDHAQLIALSMWEEISAR